MRKLTCQRLSDSWVEQATKQKVNDKLEMDIEKLKSMCQLRLKFFPPGLRLRIPSTVTAGLQWIFTRPTSLTTMTLRENDFFNKKDQATPISMSIKKQFSAVCRGDKNNKIISKT